jgi:tetratricopeptide (TPR) repeat protein
LAGGDQVEERINYFERMLADNPDNPTGLLALANEYQKAGRYEDEAAVLERYVSLHERERTLRQRTPQIRFRALLIEDALEIELV